MKVSGQNHTPAALPPAKNPGNRWIGGWMGPRVCLEFWEKWKIPCPTRIRTRGRLEGRWQALPIDLQAVSSVSPHSSLTPVFSFQSKSIFRTEVILSLYWGHGGYSHGWPPYLPRGLTLPPPDHCHIFPSNHLANLFTQIVLIGTW
jgi:hypothetical protein